MSWLYLACAYLGGVLTVPLAGAAWWRLYGKRWLARKMLGPLAGALATAPPLTTTGAGTLNIASQEPPPTKAPPTK